MSESTLFPMLLINGGEVTIDVWVPDVNGIDMMKSGESYIIEYNIELDEFEVYFREEETPFSSTPVRTLVYADKSLDEVARFVIADGGFEVCQIS